MEGINKFRKMFKVENYEDIEIKEVFGLVGAMTQNQMLEAKKDDLDLLIRIVISEYEKAFIKGQIPKWFLQILVN